MVSACSMEMENDLGSQGFEAQGFGGGEARQSWWPAVSSQTEEVAVQVLLVVQAVSPREWEVWLASQLRGVVEGVHYETVKSL